MIPTYFHRMPIKFHRVPNYFNKAPTNALRFLSVSGLLLMLMGFVSMFNRDLIRLKGIPFGLGLY